MENVELKAGSGYWDCTFYPIGGCFRRAGVQGLKIQVTEKLEKRFHGSTHKGRTQDDKIVAFDINQAWIPETIKIKF